LRQYRERRERRGRAQTADTAIVPKGCPGYTGGLSPALGCARQDPIGNPRSAWPTWGRGEGTLIDATKSGLYAVRRRAIEMLLPHLSDDELFSLDHTLSDRSREPIKTFLTALLARDAERAVAWLQQRKRFEYKACEAVGDLIPVFAAYLSSHALFGLVSNVCRRGSDWWA